MPVFINYCLDLLLVHFIVAKAENLSIIFLDKTTIKVEKNSRI